MDTKTDFCKSNGIFGDFSWKSIVQLLQKRSNRKIECPLTKVNTNIIFCLLLYLIFQGEYILNNVEITDDIVPSIIRTNHTFQYVVRLLTKMPGKIKMEELLYLNLIGTLFV